MKTKSIYSHLLILSLGLLLFQACKTGRPQILKVDPAYGKYVSAYTSGMIHRKSTIRIELTADQIKNISSADSTDVTKLFKFEPEIKGKAIWTNQRVIEFVPEKELEVGQFYNVDFDLAQVSQTEKKYDNFHFQFATYQQTMFVEVYGIQNQGYEADDLQRLSGQLTLTDHADLEKVKQTLKATQNGKELAIKIKTYNYDRNRYHFYIDSITRDEVESQVLLSWNGEAIQSISRGTRTIAVSAKGKFSFEQGQVMDQGDQYVQLTFSEALDPNQDFNGLIMLDDVDKLTYSVEYNQVSVYLPHRLVGDRKLQIRTGIKSITGRVLQDDLSQELTFKEPKPAVRIIGSGSILPNSKGLIFPFEAISLKAVSVRVIKIYESNVHHFLQVNDLGGGDELTRFGKVVAEKKISLTSDKQVNLKQWNKHVLDLGKLIKPDRGSIYRVAIKFEKEDALCDCSAEETEQDEEEEMMYASGSDSWNEKNWHGYGFGGGYDTWSYYSDDYSPCSSSYYYGKAVARNILASDLGIIFKLDEDKLAHAFVSDMLTTDPVAHAEVNYYTYSKQLIASGFTDEKGMLEVKLKQKPFLMLVKRGEQRGYLKLLDGNTNSLSKFEVEGEVVQKGVKGYLYAERGVWRPGDSLFINFMLEDQQKTLPLSHPLKFELRNPSGQIIQQISKHKNLNGLYDFACKTADEAPTGNYTAAVHVGNRVFSKTLKVETVKANRLKIYLEAVKNNSVKLAAKWLHGASAKNLKANVSVSLRPTRTQFKNHKGYTFDSPIRSFYTDQETIFSGQLNGDGEAQFKDGIAIKKEAPGMLRAQFFTKVFEQGGGFSVDQMTMPYSPFKNYVGIRSPRSDNYDHTLLTGQTHRFEIASVNEKGEAINLEKVQVKVYKLQWRWWYDRGGEDLANYVSKSGTIVIKDTTISSKHGKATFGMKVNYPDWGRYLITVTDLEGKHQTGTIVTVDWPYWNRANRKSSENANMLNMASDREKYVVGNKVKVTIPSPAKGRALISVETSSKVLQKYWIETKQGETVHEFVSTKEMAPNVYIHVTLVQPHDNTVNDLPIRMYGVIPILVDDPDTRLNPVISMEDKIRPEATAYVKVKEQNGKKMTYTLALVDEGLLDLTRFSTPSPWSSFYAKEALGVKTWDMYDDVIGAYAGKIDKLLSIGGDGSGKVAEGAKANRFKPMVIHLGPFELKAGQERKHAVEIPNYVGSIRVMVVAQQDGAYGDVSKDVAVKKPLMVLASLPRVLGPGEELALPVNVFAMEKHVKDVQVTLEVNGMLHALSGTQKSIKFDKIGDEVVNFKLKVAEKIGLAKVKVIVRSGNEIASHEIELDVRSPNPLMVDGKSFVIEPGKTLNTSMDFTGMSGTNESSIELSRVPEMGLEQRMDELIRYPHGCIEQTTSAAFPQLLANKILDLSPAQSKRIDENTVKAIKRIQLFQTGQGGFAYWPGGNSENEWGTNYAGHYLLEAEKRGYALPTGLKERWIKFQKNLANNWQPYGGQNGRYQQSSQLTQAYRLYGLALAKKPEPGAMNRLRESKDLSVETRWRLAAAYNLIGQTEAARHIVDRLPITVPTYRELSQTFGSTTRDKAMILEACSLMNKDKEANQLAEEIAAELSSKRWLSTQETAYSLIAMSAYIGEQNFSGGVAVAYQLNKGKQQEKKSAKSMVQLTYNDKNAARNNKISVKNLGKTKLFAKVVIKGIPLVGDKSSKQNNLDMHVVYKDLTGKTIDPKKIEQGTDFVAEVTLTNPGKKGRYQEMALTQIFPSGWEIHNDRLFGNQTSVKGLVYQDIRDDRVYSYYDLAPKQSIMIQVKLNATYIGRYYMPTVYSEAMYDNMISSRVHGDWVEVIETKQL